MSLAEFRLFVYEGSYCKEFLRGMDMVECQQLNWNKNYQLKATHRSSMNNLGFGCLSALFPRFVSVLTLFLN